MHEDNRSDTRWTQCGNIVEIDRLTKTWNTLIAPSCIGCERTNQCRASPLHMSLCTLMNRICMSYASGFSLIFGAWHTFSCRPVNLYSCMSVCVYVGMSVCLYVCMSVCRFVCMSVGLYVCTPVRFACRTNINVQVLVGSSPRGVVAIKAGARIKKPLPSLANQASDCGYRPSNTMRPSASRCSVQKTLKVNLQAWIEKESKRPNVLVFGHLRRPPKRIKLV